MHPLIAISTLPRVGSNWAYNVARQLARAAGFSITPTTAPKRDEEMLAAADAYLGLNPVDTFCIIKVHMPLYQKPKLKVIYLERDLRDRIFSIHRFENRPLTPESVALEVTASFDMASHYAKWPSSNILRLQFDLLEIDSINLIWRIANFMALPAMSDEKIRGIDAKLSKKQLKKEISELERTVFDGIETVKKHSVSKVTGTSGNVRAYDNATGFQSGHVSEYRSGDWERLWSDKEKKIVDNAIRSASRVRK